MVERFGLGSLKPTGEEKPLSRTTKGEKIQGLVVHYSVAESTARNKRRKGGVKEPSPLHD